MNKNTIGWDIGGAHLKIAIIDTQGAVLAIQQVACPLWKGIHELQHAARLILTALPAAAYQHVITMTGELADCFTSRIDGVTAIIQTMQQLLQQPFRIYASQYGFIDADDFQADQVMAIASANWLASATLVSKQFPQGLFVDIGSTTSDLININNHTVAAHGYTDYARLVSGELVYTGVVRTAVMAIAQRAVFNGQEMGLMAEYFATMADVYRLTGDLASQHDQAETADGADKTPIASARRLSRLTGYEFNPQEWQLWLTFAQYLKNLQKQQLWLACQAQLQHKLPATPLIGAGVGRFLLQEIAIEQGIPYYDFNSCLPSQASDTLLTAADCAPAAAVAFLGYRFG